MRTHKASQKQSSASNSLVSRPCVAQPKPEENTESQATPEYASQMPEFSIFNPDPHQTMPVQPQLAIGTPGDKYEQEADQTAKLVVQRINTPAIARSTPEPLIQRREGLEGGEATNDLESAINSARGGGQSLDTGLQERMSAAMGADFSGVRIHADAQADELNRSIQARAFTTGQDVFFRQGEYQPGSRGGQELIAHELTHVVQQNGGTVERSLQRKVLDTDTILQGIPAILKDNTLLADKGELKLDTQILGDKTLKDYISDIISNYESHFEKGSKDAVINNAMRILAAFSEIGRVIARKLHIAQEHPKITKALLESQKAELQKALMTGDSEEESPGLSKEDASETLEMVDTLAGSDPVGMYIQEKTSLRKAESSIRQMAEKLNKKPLEVFELLRQQYESRIGALTLKDVEAGEVKAPEGYMFPLKDLYGEVSVNFFQNLLDLDNGKAKWGDSGLVYKNDSERKSWQEGSGSGKHTFKVNDLKPLHDAVAKEKTTTDDFTITDEEQKEKGWERLNDRQMEYLNTLDEKEVGSETEENTQEALIQYFIENKKLEREAAIEKVKAGVNYLTTKPVTVTTKTQDMLQSDGEIIDEYKPFFSIFMHEQSLDSVLPNLGVKTQVNIIEDVLGRGLDYGQYRMEKDESQIGDSPLQLRDLPVMSCVNFTFEKNQGPNYYGDTHFVLKPDVRQRAVLAYGTGAPERRSPILLLKDVLDRDPAKMVQICDGTYSQYDIEVHIYGNIQLGKDIQNFHLGNPNALVDADKRGGQAVPSVPGTPTEQLKILKGILSPKDLSQLKNVWIKKQKGHEKLKELVRSLDLVDSNIDELVATQTIDEDALAKETVPAPKEEVVKNKGNSTNTRKRCCYITTACVTARGLPDDCEELQTLRQFRDQYMLSLPTGQDLVEFYYEQSPRIVDAINGSTQSEAIYEDLYKVIRECVDIIHQAQYQKALTTYISMVLKLRDKFTPDIAVPRSLLDATFLDAKCNTPRLDSEPIS
ncbi:MAG TPA: DUF4157 domain-containing protein [Trichormus sp. M33_DOE_039]|nr:DUF4157 domain-containing protein [Trichormus sp. M33_DOE_039]